jgi:hypothetical protein
MAAKKRAKNTPANGDAFAVALEQLRGDFRVFGEALAATNDRFDSLERTVTLRFDRLQAVALEHGQQLKEHGQQLKEHGQQLREIRSILERKVDRDEVGGTR